MAKRGPKTAAGRRAVRLNAVRHGVSSESPVIPGIESEEQWQKFRAAWVESLEPVGFVEERFAEETAILWWRKQRAHRYERDAAALRLAAADGDISIAAAFGTDEHEYAEGREALATLERGERLLRELPHQADNVALPPEDASALADFLRGEFGVPRHLATARAGAGDSATKTWTAGGLRALIEDLARGREVEPLDLDADALGRLRDAMRAFRQRLAVPPADPAVARLARSLPDERRAAGLHRAEAHLDRLFYRALHELEVMQARRGARPGPLPARVQFHGLGP